MIGLGIISQWVGPCRPATALGLADRSKILSCTLDLEFVIGALQHRVWPGVSTANFLNKLATMGRQIRPARVYQAMGLEIKSRVLPGYRVQEPPWFQAMRDIPPAESLTRPITNYDAPASSKQRKPRNIYKPPRIVHEEDALRTTFYRDHPWELARPRIVLETDGKDYQRCDWSKGLRQPGLPLTGECVVQRQLYFMHSHGMSKDKAYDTARKEFYALRQEEEIEKRVAREEARHVGAYFGKNKLQIGQDLEDKEFETWKGWASQRALLLEASRTASYSTFGEEEKSDDAVEPDAEAEVAEA